MTTAAAAIATIDQFLSAVNEQIKIAESPLSEPGSKGGETSHPVKSVDDRLQKKPEGERFKENTTDVKEDQGPPSVENAPEAKAASVFDLAARFAKGANYPGCGDMSSGSKCPTCHHSPCTCKKAVDKNGQHKKAEGAISEGGSAESDQIQIGTKKTPTGEDPAHETESAKGGKEDPGSSHPARTDNDSLEGGKYAFDKDTPLEKLAEALKECADDLCAQIAHVGQQQGVVKTAQHTQQPQQPRQGATKQADVDPQLAAQVGYEMAGLINGTLDKQAADSMVQNTLYQVIKTAYDDADRYILYMDSLQKAAEPEPPPPDAGGGGGGMPPGAGPPPGGGGGGDAAMMAALGGGAPGAGGPPPDAGGGGPPPGAGGGGDPEQEAQALAMILERLGVTPEMIEQQMQQMGGAGGGGAPPPGAGGPPPGAGGPPPGAGGGGPPPGMEAAASDRDAQTPEKQAAIRQYITELVSRSRARK